MRGAKDVDCSGPGSGLACSTVQVAEDGQLVGLIAAHGARDGCMMHAGLLFTLRTILIDHFRQDICCVHAHGSCCREQVTCPAGPYLDLMVPSLYCAGPFTGARREERLPASLSGDGRRTDPRQELLVLLDPTAATSFPAHLAHWSAPDDSTAAN